MPVAGIYRMCGSFEIMASGLQALIIMYSMNGSIILLATLDYSCKRHKRQGRQRYIIGTFVEKGKEKQAEILQYVHMPLLYNMNSGCVLECRNTPTLHCNLTM